MPIHKRPPLRLPGDARVAVWTIVNVENWSPLATMPRAVLPPPMGQPLMPDVPNWAWHEYGMRVGFWRFHQLFERLAIKPTLSVNARVCVDYPGVAQACLDSGWEFMGHSWEQGPIHKEPDQRAMIQRSLDRLESFTGKRPVGMRTPSWDFSPNTLALEQELGLFYDSSLMADDDCYELLLHVFHS